MTGTDGESALYNDGVCPVCGEEFVDGFDGLDENESYDAKVCIETKTSQRDGKALIHIQT